MLKKLLKYDIKNIYKFLIIFYSLTLFFSILTRIFIYVDNSVITTIIKNICLGTSIAMMINILINNTIRLWVRFKESIYGDESYLTHTLPVTKKKIYLSKFILSILTLLVSTIIIVLSIIIIFYNKDNFEVFKNVLQQSLNIYDISIYTLIFAFLLILFLELFSALQAGYTGIILGNRRNNNRTLFSILYGFIIYIVTQLIVLISVFIVGIFNSNIMDLFTSNNISSDILKLLFILSTIIYLLIIIFVYIFNIKILSKGVNVE